MARERIEPGFEVFAADGELAFGAVESVSPGQIVIYVENWGEFTVPMDAVAAVHDQKVILDRTKLDRRLRKAIAHAHDAEDPNA